ncbi:glycerol-3-phosphate catabolic process [Trichomonas vaginalis G3]|nr:glycerol-3-phosphate catabolic process [Trichomonas vaginalis G3]KAI5512423.1 glycerol-3-phosphate catabolic process [Trichomonas vaginalis G3]
MSYKLSFIGSGNFGSCIARHCAANIKNVPSMDQHIKMWVLEEVVNGESLIHTINTTHENIKYLPGYNLGENVEAIGDVVECCDADFFIFVVPHQFLPATLEKMKGHVKKTATGCLLTKGINFKDGKIQLLTDTVEEILGIKCGSLMGANIANEIARGDFCESTLAFPDIPERDTWKQLFDSPKFKISCTNDIVTQQLSGTMKNIIAIGGGIVDGLNMGQSTKAAILREGFVEIYEFAKMMFPDRGVDILTMIESCGFGDIVASSYGGRNRKCAEYFVKSGKSFKECESELLNGQKLQGTLAAAEVYKILEERNATDKFPLLTTIQLISERKVDTSEIINYRSNKAAKTASA